MLAEKLQYSNVREIENAPSVKPQLRCNVALRGKCLAMALMIIAILGVVTMRSQTIVMAGYDLVEIKKQTITLQRENELLQLENAKLKAPQRIQTIATSQLGMVPPKNVYFSENKPSMEKTSGSSDKNMAGPMVSALKKQ